MHRGEQRLGGGGGKVARGGPQVVMAHLLDGAASEKSMGQVAREFQEQ